MEVIEIIEKQIEVIEVSEKGPQGPKGDKGDPGDMGVPIAWDNVTDKPATFEPSAHTHVAADITDFNEAVAEVSPPADWDTLENKPTLGTAAAADTTAFDSAGTAASAVSTHAGKTDGTAHSISGISGLQSALNAKQDAVSVKSDISGSYSYTGRAVSGSATSAAVWKIRRSEFTSAGTFVSTTTANNVKWDDRLTASYS